MATAKQYFTKAGGTKLLKQYWKAGVLNTAIAIFLLLGKSKTALEILRLAVSLKLKSILFRKYKHKLNNFDKKYVEGTHVKSNKVWIFWWQGMEKAPNIVKVCYQSIQEHLKEWDIILITEENYKQYTNFPNYIIEKFIDKKITLTHFSDLLRLELLIRHGGLWLDATVLCTSGNIPQPITDSDLFIFRPQKPGADGRAMTMSSWLMYATTNNRILMATREMLYDYWKNEDYLINYFLLHYFMSIALDRYQDEANLIYPYDNSLPHLLQLHLFDTYQEKWWNEWKRLSCFHKLSYKLSDDSMKKKGTYWKKILEQ